MGAHGAGRVAIHPGVVNLIYFVTYLGVGSLNAGFLTLFLADVKGLDVEQVGVVAALRPACTLLAAPAWAALADATGRHKLVYTTTAVGSALCRSATLLASGFAAVVAVVVGGELVGSGSNAVLDAAVMATLADPAHWGRHRLWGAVGYGIAVLAVGVMIDRHGSFAPMFAAHASLVAAGVMLVRARLPMGHRVAAVGETPSTARTPLSAAVLKSILFSSMHRTVFFAVVFLCGVGSGVIENFLFLFLRRELGASRAVIGLGRTVTCASEVPMFWFAPSLIKTLGHLGVLAFACVCYIVRFVAYAHLTGTRLYLVVETLHGVTYAVMWNASAAYAFEIAPPGLGTTAQGLLSGVHWGLGQGLGAVVGGALYGHVGPRAMFRVVTAAPALSLVLLALLALRDRGQGGSPGKHVGRDGAQDETSAPLLEDEGE